MDNNIPVPVGDMATRHQFSYRNTRIPAGVGSCCWHGTVNEFLATDIDPWLNTMSAMWTKNMRHEPEEALYSSWYDYRPDLDEQLTTLRLLDDRYGKLWIIFEYTMPGMFATSMWPNERKERICSDVILVGRDVELIIEFKGYKKKDVERNGNELGLKAMRAVNGYRIAIQGHHNESFGKSKETLVVMSAEKHKEDFTLEHVYHKMRSVRFVSPRAMADAIAYFFRNDPIPPKRPIASWLNSSWKV